jgi:Flp pilus assembly protein TadG
MRDMIIRDDGAIALEFALTLPVFLLLVFGIFGLALTLWTENSIQYAVEQAARCAAVDTTECGTVAAVQSATVGWAGGIPITAADITVNLAASCAAGESGKSVAIRHTISAFAFVSVTTVAEACYPALN